MSVEKVINAIKKYNKFLIISHIDLEGDSIGCQLAFEHMLRHMGKEGFMVNGGELPSMYEFLGIKESIITDLDKSADYEYDAVAVLDCPVIKRIGKAKKLLKSGKPIINIDHHVSNDNFGQINWVEPDTSSCGEMIYKLYKALNIPIDEKVALYMYIAILTDTGSFAYENTSSLTHEIAADLIGKGVDPHIIYQRIYETRTIEELGLLRDSLSTLSLADGGKIAHMHVSKKMLNKYKLGPDVTEGFINYARSVKGAKIAVIFIENPLKEGYIQISFRSKGEVNVDALASLFGGGGHKNASGCVVKGSLNSVMKEVLGKANKNI